MGLAQVSQDEFYDTIGPLNVQLATIIPLVKRNGQYRHIYISVFKTRGLPLPYKMIAQIFPSATRKRE